jgi:hypothetical protein
MSRNFNRFQQSKINCFISNGLEALDSADIAENPESGSGPGGRWFESTRPDHFLRILNEINGVRSAKRHFFRLCGLSSDPDLLALRLNIALIGQPGLSLSSSWRDWE